MPTSCTGVIASPSSHAPRNTSDTGPITDICAAVPAPRRATAPIVKVTGKNVELSVSVDPELLGGVVATIGSTVYDGSVKTQLQRMRQELVEQ